LISFVISGAGFGMGMLALAAGLAAFELEAMGLSWAINAAAPSKVADSTIVPLRMIFMLSSQPTRFLRQECYMKAGKKHQRYPTLANITCVIIFDG
jgi:hypothetical protein